MEQPDVSHKIIPLDRQKDINNHVTSLNLPELQTSQRVLLLIGRFVSSCNPCSENMLYSWPRVQSSRLLRHAKCPHLQAATHRGNQKQSNCLLSPSTCLVYTLSLRRSPHRRNWLQAVGFMQLECVCMKPIETKFFGVGAIFFCSVHADRRIACIRCVRVCVCVCVCDVFFRL
jgi:hypothetical protein